MENLEEDATIESLPLNSENEQQSISEEGKKEENKAIVKYQPQIHTVLVLWDRIKQQFHQLFTRERAEGMNRFFHSLLGSSFAIVNRYIFHMDLPAEKVFKVKYPPPAKCQSLDNIRAIFGPILEVEGIHSSWQNVVIDFPRKDVLRQTKSHPFMLKRMLKAPNYQEPGPSTSSRVSPDHPDIIFGAGDEDDDISVTSATTTINTVGGGDQEINDLKKKLAMLQKQMELVLAKQQISTVPLEEGGNAGIPPKNQNKKLHQPTSVSFDSETSSSASSKSSSPMSNNTKKVHQIAPLSTRAPPPPPPPPAFLLNKATSKDQIAHGADKENLQPSKEVNAAAGTPVVKSKPAPEAKPRMGDILKDLQGAKGRLRPTKIDGKEEKASPPAPDSFKNDGFVGAMLRQQLQMRRQRLNYSYDVDDGSTPFE